VKTTAHPEGRLQWNRSGTETMKIILFVGAFAVATLTTIHAAGRDDSMVTSAGTKFPPKVLSFCADKERQVKRLSEKLEVPVAEVVTNYFDCAKRGDWVQAFDLFREVTEFLANPPEDKDQQVLEAVARGAALDVQLALTQFVEGQPKYAAAFGSNIIRSLPRGSVYFGGTDPGRGLATAYCGSHEKAEPAFVMTQNALADGGYLTYLRTMYGDRISIPSKEDSSAAFSEYLADAQRRLDHDERFPNEPKQLKPGEDVRRMNNRVNVSGQVAVMSINGLLAKQIFDASPDREFFVEESFPLEWMYPHLSPHGLIMKIHREPLTKLSSADVEKDRDFWLAQQKTMIGDWLKPETSVKDICEFAEKVFGQRNLEGFTGDPKFLEKENPPKMYSKLRSSIAGMYAWRAGRARGPEKDRMNEAADFAFRQAFALCPSSPEAVFRYVNLLVAQKRFDEVLLLAETSAKIDPSNGQLDTLITEVRRLQKR
jgi:hypothetical protein